MEDSDGSEMECRVCRSGSEEGRPLYTPCLCSGSIGLVHQDCLEAWLDHSKKDTCELCFSKYKFTPQYAEDTPDIVPLPILAKSVFKIFFARALPLLCRVLMAVLIWLVFVPIGTTCIFSTCVGRKNLITSGVSWDGVKSNINNGIVIDSVIALSLLILMSFTDFLRFHWIPGQPNNPQAPRNPHAPPPVPGNQDHHQHVERHRQRAGHGPDVGEREVGLAPFVGAGAQEENHRNQEESEDTPVVIVEEETFLRNSQLTEHLFEEYLREKEARLPRRQQQNQNQVNNQNQNPLYNPPVEPTLDFPHPALEERKISGEEEETGPELTRFTFHKGSLDLYEKEEGSGALVPNSSPSGRESLMDRYDGSPEGAKRRRVGEEDVVLKQSSIGSASFNTDVSSESMEDLSSVPGGVYQLKDPDSSFKPIQSPTAEELLTLGKYEFSMGSHHPQQTINQLKKEVEEEGESSERESDLMGLKLRSSSGDLLSPGGFDPTHEKMEEPAPPLETQGITAMNNPDGSLEGESEWSQKSVEDRAAEQMLESIRFNIVDPQNPPQHINNPHQDLNNRPQNRNDNNVNHRDLHNPRPAGINNPRPAENRPNPQRGNLLFPEIPPQNHQPPEAERPPERAGPGRAEREGLAAEEALEEEILNEDAQEVGLEIRVALFELLGLEGPYHLMIRNSLWLLGFCSLYLTTLVSFPYLIGRMGLQLVFGGSPGKVLSRVLPAPVWEFVGLIAQRTEGSIAPLKFFDFLFMSVGFSVIIGVIYLLDLLCSLLQKIPVLKMLQGVADLVNKLAVVVKVGVLLVMRIFLLPVFLGIVLLTLCSSLLYHYSAEQWAHFLSEQAVGAVALAWVAGITFMLSMTISVLQLREVLHPDVFGKLIRPQEAHTDLISSLINESGFTHLRRITVSLLVYLFLMTFLVLTPLAILNRLLPWCSSRGSFDLHVWYLIPEIQLPMELLVGHIFFLSLLDKRKDGIGKLQHLWMVVASRYLGLTRFLIPLPVIRRTKIKMCRKCGKIRDRRAHIRTQFHLRSQTLNAPNTQTISNLDNLGISGNSGISSRRVTQAEQKIRDEAICLIDSGSHEDREVEHIVVGRPLKRPPPGWDLRNSHHSTRWAWGTEEPSLLERSLAPRVAPKWWLLRCAALLLLSWLLLTVMTLVILLVPLSVGRGLFNLSQLPPWLKHDPVCYIVGGAATISFFPILKRWNLSVLRKIYFTWKHLPIETNIAGIRVVIKRFLTELSLGLLIMHLQITSPATRATWARHSQALLSLVLRTSSRLTYLLPQALTLSTDNPTDPASPVQSSHFNTTYNSTLSSEKDFTFTHSQDMSGGALYTWFFPFQAWCCGAIVLSVVLTLCCSDLVGGGVAQFLGLEEEQVQWLIEVKGLFGALKTAIALQDFRLDLVRLRTWERVVVGPFFHLFFVFGAAPVVLTSALISALVRDDKKVMMVILAAEKSGVKIGPFLASFYLCMRFCVALLFCLWAIWVLYFPSKKWVLLMYRRIRDDNYLIGRRLENKKQKQD